MTLVAWLLQLENCPLHIYAERNDLEGAQRLIGMGADVNARNAVTLSLSLG